MPLTISRQNVNTWIKIIKKSGLKGSTSFGQQAGKVWISASGDHKAICLSVLGKDSNSSSLDSYLKWEDVQPTEIVELIYSIEESA